MLLILASCGQKQSEQKSDNQSDNPEPLAMFSILEEETNEKANFDNTSDSLFSFEKSANSCEPILSIVYQKLSLKSDKEYLEKLNYLYEATSQQDLNTRRSSTLGISVPDYGTLNWGSNKSKVQSIYRKYRTQVDYSLNYDEKIELLETYSRSEDVQVIADRWLSCIGITNNTPFLHLDYNDDSTVIVSFRMQPNDWNSPNDKVRVTNITFPDNLTLIKGDLRGQRIKYSGTYTLKFKRKNLNHATIIVDLEKGNVLPVNVPAIIKAPVFVTELIKESKQFKVEINVSANWMNITSPNGSVQKVTFKNQDRSHYRLTFNVKTILKNPDAVVYDYYYSPTTGGLGDFQKKGVKIEPDGTLSLDCYMVTGAKKMKGTFNIYYGISRSICVANCVD